MSTTPSNESTRVNSPTDERTSVAGFPYLGYPPRVSTPVLRRTVINATQLQAEAAAEAIITDSERWGMPVARQQERVGQAAVHAAMIVQSALIFDLPTSQAIRMFAPCSPPTSINTLPRTPADTPSPEPLPIPPRRVDTPFPHDLAQPSSPVVPPVYSPQYAPPDYTPHSPTPEPQEERESSPPTSTAETPGAHPGPGWIPNVNEEGILHEYTVPVGEEGLEIAPFFQYDFDTDTPEILLTRGRNCRVHARFLRARSQPYPCPILTQQQKLLFRRNERHTRLVDQALDLERDVTLRAKVQHFRRDVEKAARAADFAAEAKEVFNQARLDAWNSAKRLADADAYTRLRTRILTEVVRSHDLPRHVVIEGLQSIHDRAHKHSRRREERCRWCRKDNHDTAECGMMRQCLYCMGQGHLEADCRTPHLRCTEEYMCNVPHDHRRFHYPCIALTLAAAQLAQSG
jgi:hypothetical protein